MVALAKKIIPGKLYFFPDNFKSGSALPANMNAPIRPSDWVYCLNRFQQYSPLQDYVFTTDRAFTLRSCVDAIVNNLHCHEDIALNIVAPNFNLPFKEATGVPAPVASSSADSSFHGRKYLDNLLSEIRLLSELVPKSRTVNYLHVSNAISTLLSPAELTELMFNLSRNFSLRHDGSGRYVIELTPAQCCDGKIALYKGLGFNHVCLDLVPSENPQKTAAQIADDIQLMREYEFESVHTRVHLVKAVQSVYQSALSNLIKAAPDSICILDEHADQSPLPPTTLPPLTWEHDCLLEGDYDRVSCRHYVRQDYDDNVWHIHDLLTVGIGGTSFIDNMFTHNADQLDQYYELLAGGKLPFIAGGYIHRRKIRTATM
jgi:hypothetical protein